MYTLPTLPLRSVSSVCFRLNRLASVRRPALTFALVSIGATYGTATLASIILGVFVVASSNRVKGLVEIVEDEGHNPPSRSREGPVEGRSK